MELFFENLGKSHAMDQTEAKHQVEPRWLEFFDEEIFDSYPCDADSDEDFDPLGWQAD